MGDHVFLDVLLPFKILLVSFTHFSFFPTFSALQLLASQAFLCPSSAHPSHSCAMHFTNFCYWSQHMHKPPFRASFRQTTCQKHFTQVQGNSLPIPTSSSSPIFPHPPSSGFAVFFLLVIAQQLKLEA
jgi:hypothetical protein